MQKDIQIVKPILILFLILLFSCDETCYRNNYQVITNYQISTNSHTVKGIRVDDPLLELNLEEVDRQTDSLEECLGEEIRRECLVIKVAPDWYISPCSGQELFPCDIDDQVCEDKGITPTEECPCNCRAMIQDENSIIVTPNLYLYRAELARMVTGVNNPWINGLSHCLLD